MTTANEYALQLLDEAEEMSNVQWHIAMIERAEADHRPHCACKWCALGRALDTPSFAYDRAKFRRHMMQPARPNVIDRRRYK